MTNAEDDGWLALGTVEMGNVAPPHLTLVRDTKRTAEVFRLTAPKGSAFEGFFRAAEKAGWVYAGAISGGAGGKFFCPNPDHADEHASLDVHAGTGAKEGMPVATCTPCREAMGQDALWSRLVELGGEFRGKPCDASQIDWGPAAEQQGSSGGGGKGKTDYALVATYHYKFFDGSPNFRVRRLEDRNGNGRKTFQPQRWDTDKAQFVGGRGALDAVLRTPLFFECFEEWEGETVYLVEGEKAATAIVERGYRATCFHGGTAGKRMDDWVEVFKRFTEVRVWTDLDEAGLRWAKEVRDELRAAGIKAEIICNNPDTAAWVPKGDAVEQLAAGGNPVPVTATAFAKQIIALHPMPVPGRREVVVETAPVKARNEYVSCWPNSEPRRAAQIFLNETGLANGDELLLRSVGGTFFISRGDHYGEIVPAVLGEKVAQFFDGKKYRTSKDSTAVVNVKTTLRREIIAALEGLTLSVAGESHDPELRAMLTAEGGIPFRNGWLDIETGVLVPHRTDRFNTWCVPGDYEPGEWTPDSTPLWVEFLNSAGFAGGTENYRVLRQWFGYVLSGRTSVDRAMVLWGPRRSGKGTVLHVLSRLVGDAACATNMRAMTSPFGLAQMVGKTLATIDDCKWEAYDRVAIEKMLTITAHGEVPVNRKYRDEITVRLGVRLMIASNDFPNFKQESNAIAGRLLIVPFTVSHYGAERLSLKRELEAELAGIAKWALGGLVDLDANGGRFTVTAEQKEFEDRVEVEGSEVKLFVSEACEFVPLGKGAARIPLNGPGSLFDAYQDWARLSKRSNYDALTKQAFESRLLDHCGSRVEKKADRTKGNVVCVFGLRLRREFQGGLPVRF